MDAHLMTTDQLADAIRQRATDHPVTAAIARPGADSFARLISERLPYIATDDVGALLIHVGCYVADAMRVLYGNGMNVRMAADTATNIVTLAGEQLYRAGQQAARDDRNTGGPRGGD